MLAGRPNKVKQIFCLIDFEVASSAAVEVSSAIECRVGNADQASFTALQRDPVG